MRHFAILCLLAAAGCGGSAKPRGEPGQKETPAPKPPAVVQKPQHDYQGWKEYASPEAGIKVRFPAEPVVKPASSATGNFQVVGVHPQAADGLEYVCQWTVKAQPYRSREEEAVYLKSLQLGTVKSSNGKLVEEKVLEADGFPGRQFIVETAGQGVLHCRSYVAGKRVITLQVWGKDVESVRSANAVKFLDSLTIGQ